MFVVSLSKNKIKRSAIIGAVVLVLSICLIAALQFLGSLSAVSGQSFAASDENEILSFISSYGWQVDDEPIEVRDVVIPEIFDEVYTNYNAIQTEQGFNLEKYAGCRVKRWSYVIRNYPDTLPSDDYIRINILVCDGVVIGGDVCSVKLDGFMHGFSR